MEASIIVRRLRTFLLGLAGFVCSGAIVELALSEHTKSAIQLLPFALCAAGLVAIAAVLLRPRRATLIGLRVVMGLLLAGSCLGVFEHFESNMAFELDIRSGAATSAVWLAALKGAAPLLAPGMLAVAALIALAATYYHPALSGRAARSSRPLAQPDSPISERRLS